MLAILFPLLAQSAFLSRSSTRSAAEETSGLSDVIAVLNGMMEAFGKMVTEDNTNWGNYEKLNDGQQADKTAFVQGMKSQVLTCEGQKSAAEGRVTALTNALTQLATDLGEARGSITEITNMRNSEHATHQAEVADLTKTIAAVNNAVTILSSHYDQAGLAQVRKTLSRAMQIAEIEKLMTADQIHALTNMVQQGPDYLSDTQKTDYSGSGSQAGGATVIETLKTIRTTLMENKQGSIEKDNEARRQYEETHSAKTADVERMAGEQSTKTNDKNTAEAAIQTAQACMTQGNADISTGETELSVLQADRAHFKEMYDERTKTRDSEMAATKAAIDALQQVSVGNALSQMQLSRKLRAGLLQADARQTSLKALAAKLLKVGHKDKEAALIQASIAVRRLAQEPTAYYNAEAMNPVKNLLKQLIDRLTDELNAETSHKDWCDNEKKNSADEKLKRENLISSLNAEIPQLKTTVASLSSDIDYAAAEIQRNYDEMEDAKRIRSDAKGQYDTAKADHDEVITALTTAISKLSAIAFLQAHAGKRAAVHAKGKQSPFSEVGDTGAGGATDMLTDLLNKYSTARTQLIQEEDDAVAAHKQYLFTAEQFRTETTQTKQSLSSSKLLKEQRLGDAETELTTAGVELQQVTTYIADLAPSCDDIRVSFEERKQRREAEIQALKEALQVLDEMAQNGR
jgi:chromosome segregation ATPase